MKIDLTTPALLFSTISLLLLAYTNRFLALANIIRKLHDDHIASPDPKWLDQIHNLRQRIYLIRDMQTLGVSSLLSCTVCMTVLFAGWETAGTFAFAVSLALMVSSLTLSIIEIRMSVGALDLHLQDLEVANAKETNASHQPSPKKRWGIRFSVGSLFWLSLFTALLVVWLQDRWKNQRQAELSGVYRSPNWSIDQVLGPPNTLQFGDVMTAWASQSPDGGNEWIIAEFPNSVSASSVEVYETCGPGAIVRITAVSAAGTESEIWKGVDPLAKKGLAGGVANFPFSSVTKTRRIKLYLDSGSFPGYNEIDAIALIDPKGNKQWCQRAWASSSFGLNRQAPAWFWP